MRMTEGWQFSKPIHWHGKGFSLQWKFFGAWLVLVHFTNGEKKRWYKRTERPYRFRRWFWRKGCDRFQNIACLQHPFVTLFVFRGFLPFPQKLLIPMEVRALRVHEPELQLELPVMRTAYSAIHQKPPDVSVCLTEPGFQFPPINVSLKKAPLSEARLQADFEHFKQKHSLPSNAHGNT